MHSYNKERNGHRKLNLLIGKETEEETLKRVLRFFAFKPFKLPIYIYSYTSKKTENTYKF